jgi:hypothetical protein
VSKDAKAIESLVRQMRQIEKDVVMGVTDELCGSDADYSQQLAELKLATDNLRTSMWCAYVAKNSAEKVQQFVERHRMNRTIEFLRNRPYYSAAKRDMDKNITVLH